MPPDVLAPMSSPADGNSPPKVVRFVLRPRLAILLHGLLICAFVIMMNQVFELKDREVYKNFYGSLDSCQWLGCFLISDSVRSPIFLTLILWGQRLGLSFDVIFTLISLLSVGLATKAFRESADPAASSRFALVSITLGIWLYLIQVKLFLAVALYLYSLGRSRRWLRIALAVAAVLTHESIIFFIALHFLWRPSEFRFSLRSAAVLLALVALLAIYLGESSNVFLSSLQRIQKYNEYAAVGEVPTMSRVGPYSVLFLLFGMIGLFRLKLNHQGAISKFQLKVFLWMFMPWIVFMIFAANAVYATRLSELALLHALLVVPLASSYRFPSRLALLIFALTFGLLTLLRDVIFLA